MITEIKSAIRTIESCLAPKAFRRKGMTFHKHLCGVWQIVDVQRSRHDSSRFTISIGIAVQSLLERLNEPLFREKNLFKPGFAPSISSCILQHRLGELMPQHSDRWWPISSNESLAEIVDALNQKALPWLSQYSSEEAVRDELLQKIESDPSYPVWLQCAAILLVTTSGPKEKLLRILEILENLRFFDFEQFTSKHNDLFGKALKVD